MGLVHAEIELVNGEDLVLVRRKLLGADRIRRMTVQANADSGAYMLCVNEGVRMQLGLPKIEDQIAILADGSQHTLEVIGPIEVRFQNRRCMVDAMVLPGEGEVLLGAIPMEDMDLVVLPRERRLAVNPAHPILPAKPVK
ncbi:MAG: clan AA aspartic protease [Planctomycetes bacterium]|nr:clan AA aspartic protease [Planctomycetota bacterium]